MRLGKLVSHGVKIVWVMEDIVIHHYMGLLGSLLIYFVAAGVMS